MAAIFLTYQNNDIFLKGVTFGVPYGCAELEPIWGEGTFTLVTDVSVQTSEILQHFVGFDDLITTLHFGKNIGAITVNGIMFSDCTSTMPGMSKFYQIVGSKRGKPITLSLGGYAFTGILTDTSVQLTSQPDTMAYFSLRMNLVAHTLPGKVDNASNKYGLGFNPAAGRLGGGL